MTWTLTSDLPQVDADALEDDDALDDCSRCIGGLTKYYTLASTSNRSSCSNSSSTCD